MFEFMVFGYILDKGTDFIKSITDQDVEEMKHDLELKEIEYAKDGKIAIMTVEFQIELVNEARKRCNGDIFQYVKKMSKEIR